MRHGCSGLRCDVDVCGRCLGRAAERLAPPDDSRLAGGALGGGCDGVLASHGGSGVASHGACTHGGDDHLAEVRPQAQQWCSGQLKPAPPEVSYNESEGLHDKSPIFGSL